MKLPVSLNVVLAAAGLSWLAQPVLAQPAPGASPAPAAPDQPAATFEIYGTLGPFIVAGRTTGASAAGTMGSSLTPVASGLNAPARIAIDPSTSNIGFRGGVDLMPGLAVVWQLENTLPVDGAAAAVGFASRNSELGITGKFGTLFVGNWDTAGQLRYFRNEGDGTFLDRTKAAGLEGLFGGLNLIQGDYDGDGFMDLFVSRGAWNGTAGCHPDSLIRNNGDGTFTDRTWEAGLAGPDYPGQTAVFLDYDNDGDLDLYVGNESDDTITAPCQLFRNDGRGTFTERAAAAGVTNYRYAKAVVAGDYDGDSFPDIYVSNLYGRNRLYRNRRDGTFEDVAPSLGVAEPVKSFPAWFWDYDNDGRLDLMVYVYPVLPPRMAAAAFGHPDPESFPSLYHADGKGGFARVDPKVVNIKPCSPMGNNFGDIDNDGFPDIYLGTGWPMARDIVPNVLYLNRRGEGFADVSVPSGTAHLQKGHGIAMADFDQDGDLDIFAQMGGAFISDQFHNALFENPGNGNRWLSVRLEGRRSVRCAMGARIRAEILEDGRRRSVYRTVGSGGHFGANPLRQHLGLGRADRVELLEVTWPATGKTQTFRDLPANRSVEIVEGDDRPTVREPRPVRFGGGARPAGK